MDPYSITAEYVYHHSHVQDDQPPLWLDTTFIITIALIHIVYSFKFTTFSLAYLNAKCEEKKSGKKWTTSRLYLHAIQSLQFQDTDIDVERLLSTALWNKLTIIRYVIRILIFILCCVVLLLYITLQLNIIYEYLLACLMDAHHGSWLALICFPALLFINIGVIRYMFYGSMTAWSTNLDAIADQIAYEHQPPVRGASFNPTSARARGSNAHDPMETPETVLYKQVTTRKQGQSLWASYQDTMISFTSPYWMAMHWRLLIIFWCILATIFALPSIANEFGSGHSMTLFGLQIFLRYLCIAMTVWLIRYLISCISFGLYGRISTLFVYPGQIHGNDADGDARESLRCNQCGNAMSRFFCLSDSFGFKDTHKIWTNCKFIQLTIIALSGVILMCIWWVYCNGLLWFMGVIQILYYVFNILLPTKLHGVHYLWQCNEIQLQLSDDSDKMTHEDETLRGITRKVSHAAAMSRFLSETELKLIMLDKDDETALNATEQLLIGGQHHNDDIKISDDDDAQLRALYETDSEEEEFDDGDTQTGHGSNEGKVFSMFMTLYARTANERKQLHQERQSMRCGLCILIYNYFYSIFSDYKSYWLLILPYKYDLRPLSVLCNGPSWTEHVVTYDYRSSGYAVTRNKLCRLCCNGLLTICCCLVLIVGFMILLCVSTSGNHYMDHMMDHAMNDHHMTWHTQMHGAKHWNESRVMPGTVSESFPLCDLKWNANLSLIDLTSLTHIAYDIGDKESVYNTSIQSEICVYFDAKLTVNCSWKVVYYTVDEPMFMHLRNDVNKTDLIVVRGPQSVWDSMRYLGLFTQVALVEMASWMIPITSILPTSFVIRIVSFMSNFEGMIDTELRERYDKALFNYSRALLMDAEYEMDSLYFVGHSFGGSIAQIVAAQMNHLYRSDISFNHNLTVDLDIKSFAMSSPGLTLNSRKFWIDRHDLFVTSTVLKPQYGVIANIDVAGGLIQDMDCDDSHSCHHTGDTICNVVTRCDVYQSHNPHLIQKSCYSPCDSFMQYLNESTAPPTLDPTTEPTSNPTPTPTRKTRDPTYKPTAGPTNPSSEPTTNPTTDPTQDPTPDPTSNPTPNTTSPPTKQ
eukprot:10049_1